MGLSGDWSGTELRNVSPNWSKLVFVGWPSIFSSHPVSSFNHFPGFPYLILPCQDFHANQTYAQSLFPSGHRYVFLPETVVTMPDDLKQKRGISIGDVGVLTRYSDFAFAFIIFLPADHPYNKNKTPDSFYPLVPLKESEVCTSVDYFPRGSAM